jgi:hypothetical protein
MKRVIGKISNDTGLIWIGDPCYVLPDDAKNNPGEDWDSFTRQMEVTPLVHEFPSGVCLRSGYGDGEYEVVADIANGWIKSIKITFIDKARTETLKQLFS